MCTLARINLLPGDPSGLGRLAVMTEYRYYNAGIDPDRKLSENVQSKVSRVKTCLLYMGETPRLSDWLFLKDTSKIRAWPHDPRENSNLAVTTVAFYIKNILQFIRYLMDSHLKANRLSQSCTPYCRSCKVAWCVCTGM